MSNLDKERIRKRTILLASLCLLWLIVVLFRLIQFQVINHAKYKAAVVEQNQNIDTIAPMRGTIYDRTGTILARSVPKQSVFYTPFKGEPLKGQLDKIQNIRGILHLSSEDIRSINNRIQKNANFTWLARKIESDKAQRIQDLQLSGIGFIEENKRFYPQGKLAAQIIGSVNIDDIGSSGIEYKFNSWLEGEKGKRLILRDAKRRKYRFEILKEAVPGKDIFLTIDETIQYIAEKVLQEAVWKTRADWGTVIISQPSTGEILAIANSPTYNLNAPPSSLQKENRNRAIHYTYAPGSTFKIITASAALESGKIGLQDTFDCSEGVVTIAGKTIRDHERFGVLAFPEIIIHSSNVGAIQVGQRVGEKSLYAMIKAFGFGSRTGIELPAEERGLFHPLQSWTEISPASLSIGYEISVTALQMLQTLNVIANKGLMVPPEIIQNASRPLEDKLQPHRQGLKRVVSEKTAATLNQILQKVVQEGTGRNAHLKGYRVAGKTGTAQKYDPSTGRYTSASHIASFTGFVPTDKPAISMIVVIDDPKGPYYGGQVAAPIFEAIGTQVLRYLHVPPEFEDSEVLITAQYKGQD